LKVSIYEEGPFIERSIFIFPVPWTDGLKNGRLSGDFIYTPGEPSDQHGVDRLLSYESALVSSCRGNKLIAETLFFKEENGGLCF